MSLMAWAPLARSVAAFGVDGAELGGSRTPLDEGAWTHLLTSVMAERITGLLASAIDLGGVPATDEQADEAFSAHRESMATALLLERALLHTAARLHGVSIEFRVLKGTAVAHLDYADPSLRSFGDLDLLVRSDQIDRAMEWFGTQGLRRRYPEPRPGFDRRFSKGSCLLAPEGHEIDVHRTLANGPYGLQIDLHQLWATSAEFELGGQVLSALGPAERFVHACIHAALGNPTPRLSALRDVAQMQRSTRLDTSTVLDMAGAWRLDAVVARAVRLADGVLDLPPANGLSTWAAAFQPGRRDRRLLRLYTNPSPSSAAKSVATASAVRGLRSKASFIVSLAFPQRSYLQSQRRPRLRRWLRAVSQTADARRRR